MFVSHKTNLQKSVIPMPARLGPATTTDNEDDERNPRTDLLHRHLDASSTDAYPSAAALEFGVDLDT